MYQAVVGASAVVSAVLLGLILRELARIHRTLAKLLVRRSPERGSSHGRHPAEPGMMASPAGFAIYVYRDGRWEIESDLSTPGFEPSPPTIPGAYAGQVIKKESRPVRDP
ncbi:hypothetical protein TA3x_000608 [Tundrisphaera sp. TA3]|uniref:hypothetical protein n=1 Tax=Tundrisphaera sp. TA3 TaxID=3435775 RepID=UPI003EBC54F4